MRERCAGSPGVGNAAGGGAVELTLDGLLAQQNRGGRACQEEGTVHAEGPEVQKNTRTLGEMAGVAGADGDLQPAWQ